jgi:hypothetical protein
MSKPAIPRQTRKNWLLKLVHISIFHFQPHHLDYTLSAMQSVYTRSYRLSAMKYRQPYISILGYISRNKTIPGTRDTRVCPILLRHIEPQTSTPLQHIVIHAYPRLYQQLSQGLEGSSLLIPCLETKALILLYQGSKA